MSRVRTVAATELLLVVALVAFAGVATLVPSLLGLDEPVRLSPLLALALAGVPALLWLGYFYLQDRHEPEPKHYVAGVYVLGAFVAYPIASFVLDALWPARPPQGIGRFSGDRLVHAILLVGLAQETAKYLVVRYTVYLSRELDEPMDGIIYMTACGIGFATAENMRYLQGLDGAVFLGAGAVNTVVTTLAHACFAGLLGYVLGLAKFGGLAPLRRNLVLLGGLVAAATLNGLFHILEGVVKVAGLSVEPWRGLAWAAGFAALVFVGVSLLMRRHLLASPHRGQS